MTNKSTIRATIATIAFGAVLFSLACSTGTPTNQTANQGTVQKSGIFEGTCDGTDVGKKAENLKGKIDKRIADDPLLADQAAKGLFKFQVRKFSQHEYVEVFFEGGIHGKSALEDMIDSLNNVMESNCLLKVVFVPKGTLPLPESERLAPGFEWNACEFPKYPCPNGKCEEGC